MKRDISRTIFSNARTILVWAVACLLLATGISRATLPAGLDLRANIGAYLGGALPLSDAQLMPPLLSQTGAFTNTPNMVPHPGLIPYDLNSPLWSDAAFKQRWIALPHDGTPASPTIGYSSEGNWTYPNGTVFVKHFGLVINQQTGATRRLETRLLVRDANGGVYGASYRWNTDNSDAVIVTNPETEMDIEVTRADGVTKEKQNWLYPGQSQCISCHNNANASDPNGFGAGMVLGLKSRQLNKNYTYPQTGRTDNQLNTWSELGMFNTTLSNPSALPRLAPLSDNTATLEHRVRSYVDSNCAFCHQPGGPGPTWDARFTTPILSQNIAGDAGNPLAILQRFNLAGSRMHIRDSVDPRITPFPTPMPPIARNVPHAEWLAVMGAWANYPFDSVEAFAVGNPTRLTIRFDRAIDASDAVVTSNYAINNGVSVTGAALDPMDSTKVVLTTTQMTDGTNYRVTINQIRETTAPYNPIWVNTFEDFTYLAALLAQNINFGALIDKPTTSAAFSVSATGGASGQPVVFNSLASSICTVTGTNGTTITLTGTPGLCTIAANQAGNNTYAAATQTTQSFNVLKVFNIVLEGSQETPVNVGNGGGGGTATYDVTTKQLKLSLSYSGMEGAENNAHIHGPAARGVAAGVLFPLGAGSPKTETVTLDAAQETQLLAGQMYVNVHSTAYPNGELRGQIDGLGSAGKVLRVTVAGAPPSTIQVVAPVGAQFDCGVSNECVKTFNTNQTVRLSGNFYNDGDPIFLQWQGCDILLPGIEQDCIVQMTASRTVNASYFHAPLPPTLTSIIAGNAQATISFTPSPVLSQLAFNASCAAPGNSTVNASGAGSPIVVSGLVNGVTYSCSLTHGASAKSNAMNVTPFLQLALSSTKSRKTHGGNADFDLTLFPNPSNTTAVEPRSIGSGHKLLFEFNQPVISPTSVTAKDANNNTLPNVIHSTAGNIVTVILTSLADNQRVSITLSGINGTGAFSVTQEVGFLVGDINGSGTITAADIMALKARASATLNQNNFRFDLNLSGKIDGTDLSAAKARSATRLP